MKSLEAERLPGANAGSELWPPRRRENPATWRIWKFTQKTDLDLFQIIDTMNFSTVYDRCLKRNPTGRRRIPSYHTMARGVARAGITLMERYPDMSAEEIRFFYELRR